MEVFVECYSRRKDSTRCRQGSRPAKSVVVPGLKEVNPLCSYRVDQAVFLADPPGPDSGTEVLEWLGFPKPVKRIAQHCIH